MAKFGIAAVVTLTAAYGFGQTGIPGQALVACIDWLISNGFLTGTGMVAEVVLAAL